MCLLAQWQLSGGYGKVLRIILTFEICNASRNREVKTTMESAWSDKHEADMLDSEGAHLTPTCTNKQHYPGEARSWPQAAQSTDSSWVQHTCDLLKRAQSEEKASDQLLQLCTNILHDIERDVKHQKNTVDAAFQRRIDEYESEKKNLTDQLKKVGFHLRLEHFNFT